VTKRERYLTTRLVDFLDEELGVVDPGPTYRFFESSKKMLQRWLDKDLKRRERLDGRH